MSIGFVGGAGVKNPLSLLFALADLVLGTLRLGLADLELFVLLVISGTERQCLGVLALGSAGVKLISDVSDSEKLLVLESDVANFFTVCTMSISLPKVETTRIDRVAGSSTLLFSDFRLRHLSDWSAFLIIFSMRWTGYPALLKHSPSSLRRFSSRSWSLIILLSLKQPE